MNFNEKYIHLKTKPPFDALGADEAAVIAEAALPYTFGAGEKIASKGDIATHLFIVINGAVRMSDGKPADICPVDEILDADDIACDIVADAETGAECLVLTREQFISAARKCPSIIVRLIEQYRNGKSA